MNIQKLLQQITFLEGCFDKNATVLDLTTDSKKCSDKVVFVAMEGYRVDGHEFLESVCENNISLVVLSNKKYLTKIKNRPYILVTDTREVLAIMAANYYDHPSQKLIVVGVTGTNGKSSVVLFLAQLVNFFGKKAGVLSTLYIDNGIQKQKTINTTPDSLIIQKNLAVMVENNCSYAFMEVSSHGIDQKRILGINFAVGVFTNITHDHLDYHQNFKAYIDCKKIFFDKLSKKATAIINMDDKHAEYIIQNTSAKIIKIGMLSNTVDYKIKILENTIEGLFLSINQKEWGTTISGTYNAYNLGIVYAVYELLEKNKSLPIAMSQLIPVQGRFEKIPNESQKQVVVDYAHTPDALKNILSTIKKTLKNTQRLLVIVGCGGNRDKEKRPIMAQIAETYADIVILTSDNPRFEDPNLILKEMQTGLINPQKAFVISSREEAIKLGCMLATSADVLLIAGKGHETYQEINGVFEAFEDKAVVLKYLTPKIKIN